MLDVAGLVVDHGKLRALWDVTFTVEAGERVGLLGANGAGKSTTLGAVLGVYPSTAGHVRFNGVEITRRPVAANVAAGIALVPEGRRLFPSMSVAENLRMGAYSPSSRHRLKETTERVYEIFAMLRERQSQPAGTLSGGQQQMVAIGRALMSNPKILLLDEPFLGVAPAVIQQVMKALRLISESGVTVLLVEQNIHRAFELVDRAYVIENGRIVLDGSSEALLSDRNFTRKFLGLD
jgi:branched-chain amino acid transport system ATP-binding protein